MKKKFVSLMAVAAMLLGTACSNQLDDADVMNNGIVELDEASAPSADDFWGENLPYDEIDVDAYIEAHPETFGNVLAFDSMEEVDNLLEDMNIANYQDLESIYEQLQQIRGFSNDIIESNILYRRIYSEVAEQFSYDITDDIEIDDDEFDIALEERLEEEANGGLLRIGEKSYLNNETGEYMTGTFIETKGSLNLNALLNDKSILVVDKVVFYFFDNTWVTMPITKYHRIAGIHYENSDGLIESINNGTLDGITSDDIVISRVSPNIFVVDTDERTHRTHIGYNWSGTKMMVVVVASYDVYKFPMCTARRGEVTITNYELKKRSRWKEMWSHVDGRVSFRTKPHFEEPQGPYVMDFDGFYVRGHYTARRDVTYNTHWYSPQAGVYPYDIHVRMSNWQGCNVRY